MIEFTCEKIPLLRLKNDLVNTRHFALQTRLLGKSTRHVFMKNVLDGLTESLRILLSDLSKFYDGQAYYLCLLHKDLKSGGVMIGNFKFGSTKVESVIQYFLSKLLNLMDSSKCIELNKSFIIKFQILSPKASTSKPDDKHNLNQKQIKCMNCVKNFQYLYNKDYFLNLPMEYKAFEDNCLYYNLLLGTLLKVKLAKLKKISIWTNEVNSVF